MLAGPQFQQMALFPSPTERPAAERRNERVPVGGQYELPLKDDVNALRSSFPNPRPAEPTADRRLERGEHPVDVLHGGTYPMMMTGPEVRHQFQALDADREDVNESWTASHQTPGPWGSLVPHTPSTPYRNSRPTGERETDEELYDRKYEEADSHDTDYLGDKIAEHGYDMSHPVSLASGAAGAERGGNLGSLGKYQVLGGHHRVAVMERDNPNSLLSVQWHHDIDRAKQSKSY